MRRMQKQEPHVDSAPCMRVRRLGEEPTTALYLHVLRSLQAAHRGSAGAMTGRLLRSALSSNAGTQGANGMFTV